MAEELTAAQIARLKLALAQLLIELQAAFDDGAKHARPVDLDAPFGRLSRIDAIAMQQMAQEGQYRLRDRRRAAQAALIRIDDGDYGFCVVCDEPIGWPRLQAKPESASCVRCRSIQERRT